MADFLAGLRNLAGRLVDASVSPTALLSYAQEGEDLILHRLFQDRPRGFYVDVGAHHPVRFSNTYFFYRRGWRGINIDAMPNSMILFNKLRKRDINLEQAVSAQPRRLTYFMLNDPALNGFSRTLSEKYVREGGGAYTILAEIPLETRTLAEILGKHLPAGQAIDFLSIDVEGWEMQVLESNDWERYRPAVILVEALDVPLEEIFANDIYTFLRRQGYDLWAKTLNTLFFRLTR